MGCESAAEFTADAAAAQTLIVEVYRQRVALAEAGRGCSRVILNPQHYRTIQEYHTKLGDLHNEAADYVGRYRLFDLEICIEQVETPRVE